MNIARLRLIVVLIMVFSSDVLISQNKDLKPFNLNFNREAVIFGSGSIATVTAFVLLENIKPFTPEEISLLDPGVVNSFDRKTIGPYKEDYLGDALLYTSYLIPVSFVAYGRTRADILDLALIYGEVLLLQSSINGIIKGAVQRTRPFVYDDESPIDKKTTTDARISFFSGHTSMTTAISFFTAKVFSEYIEDDKVKILIWSGAVILPSVVSISRVETNWHFPTDVITGYIVGALIGYFIPELHKSKLSSDISVYPSMNLNKPALSLQINF
ncbi:MAG: phosphatase PAP2 family protein [Ignavibacteriaceae bacterium]|nr:phosphatase PAP2 family protein [Ignavibacteriaceae bacterium]